MGNRVNVSFTGNGTFTPPAGVTSVTVYATKLPRPFLSPGYSNLSVLDSAGNFWQSGANANGQLGNASINATSSPVIVAGANSLVGFIKVAVDSGGASGTSVSLFQLSNKGRIWSYGNNDQGQLGTGDVTAYSSPQAVAGTAFYKVFTQNKSTYAITTTGALYAWGTNDQGCLGVGDIVSRSIPTAVLGGLSVWHAEPGIALGGSGQRSTLILTTALAGYGMGLNSAGELGINSVVPASSPTAIVGGLVFKKIRTCTQASMGLTTSGALYAWGLNVNGILGINQSSSTFACSSPTAVVGGLVFADFELGNGNAFAITSAGVGYGWGNNTKGTVGDGTVLARSSPTAILGGLAFASIYVDPTQTSSFALGLTTAGVAYGWGTNPNGQLGNNSVAAASSPVVVVGGLTFLTLTAWGNRSFGTIASGQVYGWGANTNGQLGNGNQTHQSSPVTVLNSLGGNIVPVVTTTQITVVPNTALTVTLTQYNATVGSQTVGFDVSSIVIAYDQ